MSWRFAFASLALLMVIGSGVSLAAEGSLPGDIFYPIKLSVNEPVALWLAKTPERRLTQRVALVDKRLDEAERLDAEQRLTPKAKEQVGQNVTKQVAKIKEAEAVAANQITEPATTTRPNQATAKIERVEQKLIKADERLEQVLERHERVLEKLNIGNVREGRGNRQQ